MSNLCNQKAASVSAKPAMIDAAPSSHKLRR